jgi:hypothetical protein
MKYELMYSQRIFVRVVGDAVVLLVVLLLTGCGGLRPEMLSNDTDTFVQTDTTRTTGMPVVAVYRENYANANIPQHHVPIDIPRTDEASQVRALKLVQLAWPIDRLYAFTACELSSTGSCTAEEVKLFFSLGSYHDRGCRGRAEHSGCAARFDRQHLRTFRVFIDGKELDTPTLAYERHGTGPYLEELWAGISFDAFRQVADADEIRFEIGQHNIRLRGAELKPLRAIVAAVEGRMTIGATD